MNYLIGFAIYYITGLLVLFGCFCLYKSSIRNPYLRQVAEIDVPKFLAQAFIWPLILIGAFV